MIPADLLSLTDGKGVGFVVYGPGEHWKTLATVTLPPPVLLFDMEGGGAAIRPWVRRYRTRTTEWTDRTQQNREELFERIRAKDRVRIAPQPLIDVISLNTLEPESYEYLRDLVFHSSILKYNSIVVDPLMEMSVATQTTSKAVDGRNVKDLMSGKLWGGAQERASMILRKLTTLREKGMFIYFTGSEDIEKDYVDDPRGGGNPTPYSVKGTINVPGKLTGIMHHFADCMAHARTLNGDKVWVFTNEPLTDGRAHWEAKDRFGYFEKYESPNFRRLLGKIYGDTQRDAIYQHGLAQVLEETNGA